MDFRYVASGHDKTVARGIQTAENEEMAERILTSHGYKVLTLKPAPRFFPRLQDAIPAFNRVSPDIVVRFSRQLALLLDSGTDIVTSIDLLRLQTENARMRDILEQVVVDLRRGIPLSGALEMHPNAFPSIYVQAVHVGEQVGEMENSLRQIADYMEKEHNTVKSVKAALRYPIIVTVIALVVLAVITLFVFPTFVDLYGDLGGELPVVTSIVISVIDWFARFGVFVIIGLAAALVALYIYGKTPGGKQHLDRLVLKIPLFGKIIHLNELVRACRSMSIIHRAGVPLSELLAMIIDASNNSVIKQALMQVYQDVLKGEGLSGPMAKNSIFLPVMVQMVALGEASGNLDSNLAAIADSLETEAREKMDASIQLIQPAVIVILGLMVALIAVSLISAMYSFYGQIF